MVKKFKISLLALSSTLCCMALGGAVMMNGMTANASEENDANFAMVSGASVRISDDGISGIRFQSTVKESYIASVNAQYPQNKGIVYGALVAPKKNVSTITDLNMDTIETTKAIAIKTTSTPNFVDETQDETFAYYSTITYDNTELTEEQLSLAYTMELVARPYMIVTDADGVRQFVYGESAGEGRSMRQVAELATKDLSEGKAITSDNSAVSQTQVLSLLSYLDEQDSKAVLETDSTSIEFIDGKKLNGTKAYVVGGEENNATLTELGAITDCKLDVSNADLADVEIGATATIYLAGADGFVATDYRRVTQVIDTAEELRIFDQGTDTTKFKKIEGYYVLGANIVDTEWKYNSVPMVHSGLEDWVRGYGFAGTLDGMGHYITATVGSGLFNQFLTGAVIKNVAFKDIAYSDQIGVAARSLATVLGYGLNFYTAYESTVYISDVYISLDTSWFDKPRHDNINVIGILPGETFYNGNIDFRNVIIEVPTPATYSYAPDLFSITNYSVDSDCKLTNVYVVSEAVAETTPEKKLQYTSQMGSSIVDDPFETLEFFKDNETFIANVDVDTIFTADCWTIVDGVPVWTAFVDSSVKIAEPIVFSSATQTIDCDEIEGEITAVYLQTDLNKETNLYDAETGKVNLTNTTNEAVNYGVVIETTANVYKATLEVWTKVLYTKEDLRMFDQGSDTTAFKTITGCYALGANIVDTEHEYNLTSVVGVDSVWNTYGFEGTLDGKGYYVTFTAGVGLFNHLCDGAVIRNIALKDVLLANAYTHTNALTASVFGYANGLYDSWQQKAVEISNVYVSLGNNWYDNQRLYSYDAETDTYYYSNPANILAIDTDDVYYTNVVIDLNTPETYTYAPDLLCSNQYKDSGEGVAFNNVYVVGKSVNGEGEAKTNFANGHFDAWTGDNINAPDGATMGFYEDGSKLAENVEIASIFTADCWTIVDGVLVWAELENK